MSPLPSYYDGEVRIGIIGGTGLATIPDFTAVASIPVSTPWGKPSAPIVILEHPSPEHRSTSCKNNTEPTAIAFLSRHGIHHEFAAHEVNSRANIAALRRIGVRSIVAFSAVGSLQEEIKPRDFLIPDQIMDRTKGIRPFTFFEGGLVGHVPFADPFDPRMAQVMSKCAGALQADEPTAPPVTLHRQGTLVCMEGPQFSTRAESNLYRSWGGSVINMSAVPEAKLAREAEMAYQMVCMATDYDCWHTSNEPVSVELVMAHMKANSLNARRLVRAVMDELTKDEHSDLVIGKHLQGVSRLGLTTAPAGVSPEAKEKMNWLFPGSY